MHYEKAVAARQVMTVMSAHSINSKRSQEVPKTSKRLDWKEYFVPSLDDYMQRMMKAGYYEQFRRDVFSNSIIIS